MSGEDQSDVLVEAVRSAYKSSHPLRIRGSGSKFFYGNPVVGDILDVSDHCGILSYEPSELVLTARAGSKIADINKVLTDSGQILGFEPPMFGENATIGGTVACGISGPRRPYSGAVRDFVLGVKCINGKGELLSFGGQVIKNVAGYDISRLMTGAIGSLGVLCEISLKVLPKSEVEVTVYQQISASKAHSEMIRLAGLALPVSAMSFNAGVFRIRLSGTENAVCAAKQEIGGELEENGNEYWQLLREHRLDFFSRNQPLWRQSVPPTAPLADLGGDCLIDWGGALRWIYTDETESSMFETASRLGGHAMMFRARGLWPNDRFSQLDETAMKIHQGLKNAFDPAGILNPRIMYSNL